MYRFVITDRVYRILAARFRFVYLTYTGSIFWDRNKFTRVHGVCEFQWRVFCHIIWINPIAMLAYAYDKLYFKDIPDENQSLERKEKETNLLLSVEALSFTNLIVTVSLATMTQLDHMDDLLKAYNDTRQLGRHLQNKFQPELGESNTKSIENLVAYICWFPCIIPILVSLSFFHSSDPIHNAIEQVLEVQVGINLHSILMAILMMWTVQCMFQANLWLSAGKPLRILLTLRNHKQEYSVTTYGIGVVSEKTIVWLYRAHQTVLINPNTIYKSRGMVFHFVGLMICFVVSAFSAIRHRSLLIQSSSAPLQLLHAIGIVQPFIFVSLECIMIAYLQNCSTSFRKKLCNLAGRKTAIYKAARSFPPLTMRTGGEYFNVNKSTFVDWSV